MDQTATILDKLSELPGFEYKCVDNERTYSAAGFTYRAYQNVQEATLEAYIFLKAKIEAREQAKHAKVTIE